MSLRFVIARSVEHRETAAALERFGAQLGYEVGETVKVETVGSYGELRLALARGEAQLAWVPPVVLAESDLERMVPLVTSLRNGSSEYCSVLFVRADSDLSTLGDLRGKRAAWVDRCSAAGYLLPRLHLAAEGFVLDRLFGGEDFVGSHGEVVRAVFDGRADVGATFGGPPGAPDADERSGFADIEPHQPVRVIFRSGAVPSDAVVCDAALPVPVQLRVTAALLHLGRFALGRRVLSRLFGADGFQSYDPTALTPLRRLAAVARARGWLQPT